MYDKLAVDDDMLELRQRWKRLEARSRVDLGGIGSTGGELRGLKKLTGSILGFDLPKSRRMAISNWSQVPLSDAQTPVFWACGVTPQVAIEAAKLPIFSPINPAAC